VTLSSLTDPGVVRIDGGNSSFSGPPDAWPIELVRSGRLNYFSNPSGPGDVDGGGWLDLVVGALARVDNVNQVQINVVLGAGGRLSGERDVDLDAVERGQGGWTIEGLPGEGSLSTTVATWRVGDVNHDGLDDVGFVLRPAPPNHSAPVLPVRLYIADGDAALRSSRLTDLEQRQGGFTLDLPDWPTRVLSGDVDGDGLSDLVFGFASNGATGRIDGSVWVRFGIDTGELGAHGGAGDEALSGTPRADRMVGGRGDDVLSGLGGADVLSGGAGDDVLEVADAAFVRLDGGRGEDTLRVDSGARVALDLDALRERVRGVEVVDLTGAPVSLTLSASRVRRSPSVGAQMVVLGDADDVLSSPRSAWRAGGDAV
jgi:Ca2+-binding RTX toxin-like protein